MRSYILKILVVMIFFSVSSYANDYRSVMSIKLKKDENEKILVRYGENFKEKKLFKFRWTLYTNGGLVILRSYDRIVGQNVLYLRNRNQNFRVELLTRGAHSYRVPYILVKFKEFHHKTNEAEFEIFLSDKNLKVRLEYLEDK